ALPICLELLLFNAEREARRALEPFGYYAPTIVVDSTRDEEDRITVTLQVDKGEPVRVRDWRVEIAGPGGEDKYLQQDLELFQPRQGERFDHAVYEEHKDGITRRLAERGYFDADLDRKSTRLNSSHVKISYAVFCLKKKNRHQ